MSHADTPPLARVEPRKGYPHGQDMLRATFALLRQDKQMFALPFVGMVFGVIAAIALFFPGYGIGWFVNDHQHSTLAYYTGAALSGFGATVVSVYFQVALVIGANQRADGGEPTARSCLREARTFWKKIVAWSLVTATVGFVLQLIHDKLGFLGSVLNFVGGVAWGIATCVVVPVLVTEDVGPVTAVRRSTRVLRDTWGTSLRTAVKGNVIAFAFWLVPCTVLVIAGVMVFAGPSSVFVVGIVLAVVSGAALIVLMSVIGAAGTYARALIYRYAVGLPTPGIDTRMLSDAFRSKG